MNEKITDIGDELRPEYDLKSLRLRRVGADRTHFNGLLIALEPDVAALFPDAKAVNEALRFVIRQANENPLRQVAAQPV